MKRTSISLIALAVAILLAVPAAYAGQPQANDLTKQFRDGGLSDIDQLRVVEIGGIVVVRGRTADPARAAQAAILAQSLGYTRVANLVQVELPSDDAAIQRQAERVLVMHRGFEGAKFTVATQNGVVRVGGRISHEMQRDMAVNLIRNIDGVKAVYTDGLQR